MAATGTFDSAGLERRARRIRRRILEAVHSSGKGHLGGSLSIVELLVFAYFSGHFRLGEIGRSAVAGDHFLLSKGHAGVALYATLVECGLIPGSELMRMNTGHLLAEHPSPKVPGVEFVSGSLGHGLSLGAGIALANKIDGTDSRTLVLLGDGECYEGSVWEAVQFASHHGLQNLVAIVDLNGLITHGSTRAINSFRDMAARWESAGWVTKQVDGHDFVALQAAFSAPRETRDAPLAIIASTVKGKGVQSLEGHPASHHGSLSDADYFESISRLG